MRVKAATVLKGPDSKSIEDRAEFIESIRQALYASKSYHTHGVRPAPHCIRGIRLGAKLR